MRALKKSADSSGQSKITDYFDIEKVSSFINDCCDVRQEINDLCGLERDSNVKPLLERIMKNAEKNAEKNAQKTSSAGYRHDNTILKFSSALYCLMGKASYQLLQCNLGSGLPSISTLQRNVGKETKIVEGHFRFEELSSHLARWKAPLSVHIHLDDTRIIKRVEYDQVNDQFVGFCLPVNEFGLPCGDAFALDTFEEIKDAVENKVVSSYAHCIVAKPVSPVVPSFVLFVLGTDSKYTYKEIMQRWSHIEKGLDERNITIISHGSDGAGPFLKAMIQKCGLFKFSQNSTVPVDWTFYVMPQFAVNSLCSQDTIHLLAKLKTRLITPSNLLSLGTETACRGHLTELLNSFPKSRHGLSERAIDSRDKQNYGSIELLLKPCVDECLSELPDSHKANGTRIYLNLMRDVRDAFLDKSIDPLCRLFKMWKTVFFLRIWRCWLKINECREDAFFITTNAYLCAELNAHMLLNLVFNVVKEIFPPEALRIWCSGSQACEQLFRMLRAMTPTFSTIVNFTLKRTLNRIHKLQYLSSIECEESIIFPRVQRRLLETKDEGKDTLSVPSISEVAETLLKAKTSAVELSKSCNMALNSYDDRCLVSNLEETICHGIENDDEDYDEADSAISDVSNDSEIANLAAEDALVVREDLSQTKLRKLATENQSLPTYEKATQNEQGKTFAMSTSKGKSKFVLYNNSFIRKTTALYLLQDKTQLSADRLLRVRASQPSHVYTTSKSGPVSDKKI